MTCLLGYGTVLWGFLHHNPCLQGAGLFLTGSHYVYHQNQTQRGKTIMAQGVLPLQYEIEKTNTGMTSLAGLPAYLDLSRAIGLWKSIEQNLHGRKKSQGWSDTQMVMFFIMLNLAGENCVDDLARIILRIIYTLPMVA
jgi:hypothetical protein